MIAQRYPLAWPTGWKRTTFRKTAKFRAGSRGLLDLSTALGRLKVEMRRLGVPDRDWLISSDLKLRNDGFPYANQTIPRDGGVAVYFKLKRNDRVLACDTWNRMPDNIAAIAAHIECIRGIDRYGVGTIEQAFTGYASLPAKGSTWRTTLGFAPDQDVTLAAVDAAYRNRARDSHPDTKDGSHDAMASLNTARDEARREIGASA